MKKISKYAAKRRANGNLHTYNGAEWMNVIQRCNTYGEKPEIPGFVDTTIAAQKSMLLVREALDGLMTCTIPDDPEHAYDALAHALGVAIIRAIQIDPDTENNPALPILQAGNQALTRAIERWEHHESWGLDGLGRVDLLEAIEVYEEILRNSSPAQMTKAMDERIKILAGRTRMPIEVARRAA